MKLYKKILWLASVCEKPTKRRNIQKNQRVKSVDCFFKRANKIYAQLPAIKMLIPPAPIFSSSAQHGVFCLTAYVLNFNSPEARILRLFARNSHLCIQLKKKQQGKPA